MNDPKVEQTDPSVVPPGNAPPAAPLSPAEPIAAPAIPAIPPAEPVLATQTSTVSPSETVVTPVTSTTPPVERVVPPASGGVPPGGSVVAPATSTTPPVEPVAPPASGAVPPGASIVAPATSTTPPAGPVVAPAISTSPTNDPVAAPASVAVPPSDAGARSVPPPGPAPHPSAAQPVRQGTDWWAEIKGLFWLVLAVLAFHSLIAKPFYIPSESMMPTLIKGDRLVVSKYPYGWSYVSPSFHVLPFIRGRLFGHMPERGDVVILTPPGESSDYIKRVIGLPGDTIEVREGAVFLNGRAIPRTAEPPAMIPVDANVPCDHGYEAQFRVTERDGKVYCALPRFRETLPSGRTYDTIDMGYIPGSGDDYGPVTVPAGRVFVMGDNRDESADSRYPIEELGLGGPVPWENLGGRAEFITFSLDGASEWYNPVSWFTALRGGRAGTSLHPRRVTPAPAP